MPMYPRINAPPFAGRGFAEGVVRSDKTPVPLVGEHIRVVARNGLALVSREQIFRNTEESSIEATVTFPVPVHATLHRLTARIGERLLTAAALARKEARDTYEDAIDVGRTAVLHEEIVRGIHVLSISHIPAGAEIAVTHAWVAALAPRRAGTHLLRIPVTVGDVYGKSPFGDADDLIVSPAIVLYADVEIDAGSASASIAGHPPAGGRTRVCLDAPIDIEFVGMATGPARGLSADGRIVALTATPDFGGDDAIDVAIVVDRSGSMGDAASLRSGTSTAHTTKHAAVLAGLAAASRDLRQGDRTSLWQFDTIAEQLCGPDSPLTDAIAHLGAPRGGTEIGAALAAVVAGSQAADIVLITDGLSHALDVQTLANSGRPFTVVLVGADALEANVGRLAALTGGQIVLATGTADAAAAVETAIGSVRRRRPDFALGTWPLERAVVHANGAIIEARWGNRDHAATDPDFAVAVGAMAAAIALPRLAHDQAAKVAADHGIVCHLTSLVLVDEAGAIQPGLPGQRKVPLMATASARVAGSAPGDGRLLRGLMDDTQVRRGRMLISDDERTRGVEVKRSYLRATSVSWALPPSEAAKRIDWSLDPEALCRGDVGGLAPDVLALVMSLSRLPEIRDVSGAGGNAVAIVIGLLAKSVGGSDRGAARVARAILGGLDEAAVARAMTAIGL